MKIDYNRAKSICTEKEFAVILAAKPPSLANMQPAVMRKLATQARRYGDKWLQQSRRQGNSSTGAGARSFEKHELFKELLERVEAKLAKVAPPVAKAAPAKKVAPAKKAPAKKGPAKKAAVKKAAPKKKVAAEKVSTPIVTKKALSPRARNEMSLASQARQKSLLTSKRIASSGLTSRVKGHVSAAGRRNQAARSSRKR